MTKKSLQGQLLPLTDKQFFNLQEIVKDFSTSQIAWVSGYFWGLLSNNSGINEKNISEDIFVTIISASQTGNARIIANNLKNDLTSNKINNQLIHAGDYNFKKISKEKYLIIITSTQGEGEPPEEAIALYDFIMSKKAPNMKNIFFSVFGLGDTSYPFFSKAGKDFDLRLCDLGASRLLERIDADIDYEEKEKKWRKSILDILLEKQCSLKKLNLSPIIKTYNKNIPFSATVINKQKITGRFSDKEIIHIEIDLDRSGLTYEPGDSLGIWYKNDENLVKEFITLLQLKENTEISFKNEKINLFNVLTKNFELTVNTPKIVKTFADLSNNKKLLEIVTDKKKLQKYANMTPIIEMIKTHYYKLQVNQLINMLRPLNPRFYSIASSKLETENEVHITVNVVRYKINQKVYTGGASGYLSDRVKENDNIKIFIEKNNNFRLPKDNNLPIIMIGPGTGIAPFRAFIQQRNNENAKGKNWLFFGNPKFTEDFLYQVEWQKYIKLGVLSKIDLAWSRDQEQKIYVQDKIKEKGMEIWSWIKEGAYLYICGNADKMAKDVEKVLLEEVISKFGKMSIESSKDFLRKLRISRRYQRDVY